MVSNFFVGANSGEGFRNLFPELVDLENTYDFIILKGGPGVGKNTFMREIGRSMEEAGTAVEYLWCSGDPDSLDGVVIPQIRCGVVDGTSPHVLEPQYPAAVDRYVNLGRFYDIAAAKACAADVKEHTRAYKAAYQRAYQNLKAAREVEMETVESLRARFDGEKVQRRMAGILARELKQNGGEPGDTTYRFLGGVTYKGYIWRFDSVNTLCQHVYELQDSWGFAGQILENARKTAAAKGWNTIACCAPEQPERIEHLLIPSLGLAFVSSCADMDYGKKPFRRIRLDAMTKPEEKGRVRLRRKMTQLLRKDAVCALREAKERHDALEAVYNPYVDFEGVHALAAMEAGRFLSYLH